MLKICFTRLTWSIEHLFKDDVYGNGLSDGSHSRTRVKDANVYSMLFTECDSDQSGWANVDELILFIKKVLSSSSEVNLSAEEESCDSDESVSNCTYAHTICRLI